MRLADHLVRKIRCPACVKAGTSNSGESRAGLPPGSLTLLNEWWLVCETCDRKYPVVDDAIPVLTIHEGDKWRGVPVAELPARPPATVGSRYDGD